MAKDDMVFHGSNIDDVVSRIGSVRTGLVELRKRILDSLKADQADRTREAASFQIACMVYLLDIVTSRLGSFKYLSHEP